MSNGNLQPVFAAELASNVYLVKDEHTRKGFNLKYKKVFQMEESKLVTGRNNKGHAPRNNKGHALLENLRKSQWGKSERSTMASGCPRTRNFLASAQNNHNF